MKSYLYITLIIFTVFFFGCKSRMHPEASDYSSRLNLLIKDYCNKNKDDFKKYSIFILNHSDTTNSDYFFYDILPTDNKNPKYSIDIDSKYSWLPSGYINYKNKIFLVQDENTNSREEDLLEFLDSLKLLDSTKIKIQLGLLKPENLDIKPVFTDGSKKGVTYIICKNKPFKIQKRVRSRSYISPDDKRFENLCD